MEVAMFEDPMLMLKALVVLVIIFVGYILWAVFLYIPKDRPRKDEYRVFIDMDLIGDKPQYEEYFVKRGEAIDDVRAEEIRQTRYTDKPCPHYARPRCAETLWW